MAINRRQESQLRLETLGHLSDCYSGVVSVNERPEFQTAVPDFDDQGQWEIGSVSSKASTCAVLYEKPPPPGFLLRRRAGSEVVRPVLPSKLEDTSKVNEERVVPVGHALQHSVIADSISSISPQTFDTSQLRPAKPLGRIQHPAVLSPGIPKHGFGEHVGDISPPAPELAELPGDTHPEPSKSRRPSSAYNAEWQTKALPAIPTQVGREHTGDGIQMQPPHTAAMHHPGQANTSRNDVVKPTSRRSSYNPMPPRTPSYFQNFSFPRPVSTYTPYRPPESSPGVPTRTARSSSICDTQPPSTPYYDHEGTPNVPISPNTSVPRQPAPMLSPRTKDSSPTNPQMSPRSFSRATTRISGIDFEMLSPTAPIPVPYTQPPPPPTPTTRGRKTQSSTSSARSRTCPPKAASHDPHHRRQSRASFLERAQQQEQLSKAAQHNPPPPPPSLHPGPPKNIATTEKSLRTHAIIYRDASTQTKLPASKRDSNSWDISSDSEAEPMPSIAERRRLRRKLALPEGVAELEASVPEYLTSPGGEDALFLGSKRGARGGERFALRERSGGEGMEALPGWI